MNYLWHIFLRDGRYDARGKSNDTFFKITIPCPLYLTIFFTCQLREDTYDEEGNLLDEKPIDANELARKKKIATLKNKLEDLI
jgi:hypothetical protein